MTDSKGRRMVERMSVRQRLEHALMGFFVLLLIASGAALVYHDRDWAQRMISMMGGLGGRHTLHRFAAVGLLGVGVSHLLGLLFSPRYQYDFRESRPGCADLREGWRGFLFRTLGRGEPPRYGHFTPMQKFQYWGIMLGCLAMGLSGAILWSPAATLIVFPKAVFDLMMVVHSEQAQLIFLLFILWHLYDIHLAAGNFPMNPAWLTGKMPEEVFIALHRSEWEARKSEDPA